MDGYVEFAASHYRVSNEDAQGLKVEESVQSFLQRYSLNFSRRFFPNLEFRIGGVYERDDTSTDVLNVRFESWRKRLLPYVRLTLRSGTYMAELGYIRRQEDSGAGGFDAKLVQDTWAANFGWSPVELPISRLEFFRRDTYDQGKQGLNIEQDRVQLSSQYLVKEKVDLYYRGSLQKDKDLLRDGEVTSNNQNFRASYGDSWLDRRLTFSTDYTFNYRSTETTRPGESDLVVPVVPAAGLSSIDDTPNLDPLADNPALIDGNKLNTAGVNLGLPGLGGDRRPRNMGVDLGFASEMNTLLVWIDRELTPAIAATFSWRVYTSTDNLNWVLRQTISVAPFGPFDNRFELRFTSLVSRYVKVVVSPLDATIPDATSWPDILVTELEPQLLQPADQIALKTSSTSNLFNVDFRALLVPSANLYYEFGYFLSERSNGPTLYTVSNGLSTSKAISPVFAAAARLAREDRMEIDGKQIAYLFTGSLTATPLSTVQESAVVSLVQENGDFARNTASVVLSSVAQLYRGINATLILGQTAIRPQTGGTQGLTDVNFGMTLAPNTKFTINVLVQNRRTTMSFDTPTRPDVSDTLKTAEIGATYRPWRSLYLFASERWERSGLTGSTTLHNYSLSWTPFPDGTFRFNFFYDAAYRSLNNESQQTLVPSIRWDITSRITFDLSYQDLQSDSLLGSSHTKVGTAAFRATF